MSGGFTTTSICDHGTFINRACPRCAKEVETMTEEDWPQRLAAELRRYHDTIRALEDARDARAALDGAKETT